MEELFARRKEHELVHWASGCAAAAFALIPPMDAIATQSGWPESLPRSSALWLITGFFMGLALAWHRGESSAGVSVSAAAGATAIRP